MKMLKQLRWFFLLAYSTAFVIDGPAIKTDGVSERAFHREDGIYYLLANTKPTFMCNLNLIGVELWPMDIKWLLNGQKENASRDAGEMEGAHGLMQTYFEYDAGSSFKRNELKCVLNVTRNFSPAYGTFKEATIFLQVARPVSEVKAFFRPNDTVKLTGKVGSMFDAYCTANGTPKPSYTWHARYPGSSLWNEVGYTSNFSEYILKEDLPGPTLYRCQAVNLANRDTTVIASNLLELNNIDPAVKAEPTWVVNVSRSDVLFKKTFGGPKEKTAIDPTIPIVATIAGIAVTIVVAVLVFVGVIIYIKYRRRRLEHSGSGKNSGRAMRPYKNVPPHKSVQMKNSGDSDSGYSTTDVAGYLEIIPDSRKASEAAVPVDIMYLTPKASPKFLPLPNIPGRTPPSSTRNSPRNSVDVNANGDKNAAAKEDKDEENIYNEIPYNEMPAYNEIPTYNEIAMYNEIPVYENDPPAVCISYTDLNKDT